MNDRQKQISKRRLPSPDSYEELDTFLKLKKEMEDGNKSIQYIDDPVALYFGLQKVNDVGDEVIESAYISLEIYQEKIIRTKGTIR